MLSCEHHSSCPTDAPVVFPYVLSTQVSFRSCLCSRGVGMYCTMIVPLSFSPELSNLQRAVLLLILSLLCCLFSLPLKQTNLSKTCHKEKISLCGGISDCEKIWGGGGWVGVVLKSPHLCFQSTCLLVGFAACAVYEGFSKQQNLSCGRICALQVPKYIVCSSPELLAAQTGGMELSVTHHTQVKITHSVCPCSVPEHHWVSTAS